MSRFDKRASGTGAPDQERTSLKAFQAEAARAHELERQQRLAAHHAASTATASATIKPLESGLKELKVDAGPAHDDDERTLEERLLSGTDESTAASLSALLVHHLRLRHGELVLHIGGNLQSRSFIALFDQSDTSDIIESELSSKTERTRIPIDKVNAIVATLTAVADSINAKVCVLHNPFDDAGALKESEATSGTETNSNVNDVPTRDKWRSRSLRLLVRKVPDSAEEINEVRVCVVGNVDAGKSSLLGVLTKGRLDDGRGRARVALFRHKHEIESGRTSSVGLEVLGFASDGTLVVPDAHATAENASKKQQITWEEISNKSSKIISFVDLAGHERYLKTTLFGLTSSSPDFCLLIIGGNAGIIGMSKEHLSVALALSVPVVVVVTKVDMTPPNVLEQTLKQLNKILRSPGCRKQPVYVKDPGMACELASNFARAKACPIFLVSNVTGEGLLLLRSFLNVVRSQPDADFPVDAPFECPISDVFSVPYVGTVVSGVITSGRVSVGDTILLGPDSLGAFLPTAIKSIQRKRVNVEHAEAGQSVSFALKRTKRAAVRKGMVLLAKPEEGPGPVATRRFEGTVLILYHNSLISPHYQAMLHSGPIRQTVQIEFIKDKPCVRTGDRATAVFRFLKCGEHLHQGDSFILREGRTKVLGVITKLLPNSKTPAEW